MQIFFLLQQKKCNNLSLLRSSGVSHFLFESVKFQPRMQVEAAMIQETELQAVRVRKWKIFPGNNKFLGDGRCMYGPDWYGFLFCLVVYIVIGKCLTLNILRKNF